MVYSELTWGGNDSGTSNSAGVISSTGRYPAGRAAYNTSTLATTYPILVASVGANIAAVGTTARNGTITVGSATSVSKELPEDADGANIPMVWVDVSPDKLINVSSAAQDTTFKWTGNTYSVYAGRDTSSSYTTVYNGASRTGRMGGGIRYYLVPTAPGVVTATSSSTVAGRIDLSWAAPSNDGGTAVTGYNIYRSTNAATIGTSIGTSTTTTFADTGAKSADVKYYYHVTAENAVTTAAGAAISSTVSPDPSSAQGAYSPYAPSKPVISSATKSTSTAGKITVTWTGSVTTGSPAQTFNVYRNSSLIASDVSSPYEDSGLTRGTTYSYTIVATNTIGSVTSDAVSEMAPGVPSAPQSISVSSKVGRNVTIAHQNIVSGGDYGNSVTEYRLQLSVDNGTTWKGWDNSTKQFTESNAYNVVTSGSFVYSLLTPALTYLFRVYAVNSIGDGDKRTTSTGLFVSAGGRRFRSPSESDPGTFQPTETAKRYGQVSDAGNVPVVYGWIDISVAKKYDPTNQNAVNGWIDLS
jgi:hypothetical protein